MQPILPFWQAKPLDQLSDDEWESLCDGCALCCLIKLEDPDTHEVAYTRVACQWLDLHRCTCRDYINRHTLEPFCVKLTVERIGQFAWLPPTCAYRLLAEGKPLPDWHPLVSGDPQSVHHAGISVRGKALSARDVPEDDWVDYLLDD
jgi:hypothetical protein